MSISQPLGALAATLPSRRAERMTGLRRPTLSRWSELSTPQLTVVA